MNDKFYSNQEFTEIKKRINDEILRRGGFAWNDPLSSPKVGSDRTPPLSLPASDRVRIPVDDRTYTINNPSEGSIIPTRNIHYPEHGENPAGEDPEYGGNQPHTSAAHMTVAEMKNFIIGLSKINDINLFYGKDEKPGIAYRDPNGIEDLLYEAEQDELHVPVTEDMDFRKVDPNMGQMDLNPNYPNYSQEVSFPAENGFRVLPAGEYDGEEILSPKGLSSDNFFDDYGAEPGDGDYHPICKAITPRTRKVIEEHDKHRHILRTIQAEGGRRSSEFGPNPRNPEKGDEYGGRKIYKGIPGACNNSCTGLCYISCDSTCSESCTTTCTMRCGNQCTSACGNQCTGCSSLCYTSCKTKCENTTGYACVKSGIKSAKMETDEHGYTRYAVTTHTCTGCSYSCQFYPNKKTTCWDSGCMGQCFTTCDTGCISSCMGGCTWNDNENTGAYKTGIGQGCSSSCTMNCIGACEGTCEGFCTTACWKSCETMCTNNCEWTCDTDCGSGCATSCKDGCKGCMDTCNTGCKGGDRSTTCTGCSATVGCTSECQHDCNSNCFNQGCRDLCGTTESGDCDANCRMNCSSSSCSSLCEDACSSQCTTCSGLCDMNCGACTSECSNTCGMGCNLTCSIDCASSCDLNCVHSCTDTCGACFKGDTLIETDKGLIEIKDLRIGDNVLTKSGEYHKIIKTFKRTCDDELFVVRAVGAPPIYTTKNHPFWVKKYIKLQTINRTSKQIYEEARWVNAEDIGPRDKVYLLTPPIGNKYVDPGIAYMVGRWLGDGWRSDEVSHNGKVYQRYTICCGKHEVEDLIIKMKECNITYTLCEKETGYDFRIPSKRAGFTVEYIEKCFNNRQLIEILSKCGKYSYGKFIPKEIYEWDEIALSFLIQGYLDADGHFVNDKRQCFTASSVSRKLICGISMILRMLDRNPGISEKKISNQYILGRKVNLHKTYLLRSQLMEYTRYYSIRDTESTNVWATVMSTGIPDETYDVYNISVEGDPTYYADGVLVHNCSSLCFSCVSQCIAQCSIHCTNGCSYCSNNCSFWCDVSCNQACNMSCVTICMFTCDQSCSTTSTSTLHNTVGPQRGPTSIGYEPQHPSNRNEERDSFRIIKED